MKHLLVCAMVLQLLVGVCVMDVAAAPMKTGTFNDWTITLPEGWSGDNDMGMYWPGEIKQFMGRPPVSIHMGGIPVMGGITFEDRVKKHINAEPKEIKEVTVEGMKGFTCYWDQRNKKHYGMFLKEMISGEMFVINFVDCRAPADEFDTYIDAFKKIVESAEK